MTGQSDLPPDLADRADELLHTRPNADQLASRTVNAFEVLRRAGILSSSARPGEVPAFG